MRGELLLALIPTVAIFVVLTLIHAVQNQQILVASLATSAFLLYLDPRHPANRVRIIASAHLTGLVLGVASALLLGAGYLAGAVAMAATILTLVLFDIVYPPAIATTLGFAFYRQQDRAALYFLLMLALMIALQYSLLWLLARLEGRELATGKRAE